ncbi:DUF4377 domain-containing protein [Bacteroides helcogenes]|uniref:Uncharacterized protein n=1 Tax=Bacteroides helcogenes (strain ATCC 35417 / DSM 20613 / JCM 6297 / CCUG 15421 / P 36-108) TaxID=693979 RepID=E6SN69_BACT6|nr:DUF4377 domain-containing protein [Bacteroides helcogenes]ADV44722.1 hypothetical protein Bache_2779 [Bacteroides helcogenes P 36-108]MDY5238517.1 DUF4377 domain-containing protein [Bacteroides helcogenes]
MKKLFFFFLSTIFCMYMVALTSCSENNDSDSKTVLGQPYTIIVASELRQVEIPISDTENSVYDCMVVKVPEKYGNKELCWTPTSISGFTYEVGYEYELSVADIHVLTLGETYYDDNENVPRARLIKVISKVKKN